MACTNPDNPNCPNCNKSGLAILPVRYAVVPNSVDATLPKTVGSKVISVKLQHAKYVLRTLRQGYFYLYYEKHARGSQIKWEVYSVAPRGTLWKQIHKHAISPVTEDPADCARAGHNLPASVITIEKPEKCGRVWMAFSDHMWSMETFETFDKDVALRNRRMQTFDPATWISTKKYRHGLAATAENLNEIIEYKTGFALGTLGGGGGGILPELSNLDGTYNSTILQKQTSIHPLAVRRDDKDETVRLMKKIGETAVGPHHAPVVLAIWDNLGITHELNGYRSDAAGWLAKYGLEREVQIGAAAAFEGVKKALEDRNGQVAAAQASQSVFAPEWTPAHTAEGMAKFNKAFPGKPERSARQLLLYKLWEKDAAQGVPNYISKGRQTHSWGSELEWKNGNAEVDKQIAELKAPDPKTGTSQLQRNDAHVRSRRDLAVKNTWGKYDKYIDHAALKLFSKNYDAFNSEVDSIIDGRTQDLIKWLKSKWLINSLTEFNKKNIDDGVAFEDKIGTAINGIGSTYSGRNMIDEWVKEMKATETNLLWRAIALNQEEAVLDIDSALQHGLGSPKPILESAWETIVKDIKWNKIFDIAKKSLGFFNTNAKADIPDEKIKKVKRTLGLDKILTTVGVRFLTPFAKAGDCLNAAAVKAILAVRAGGTPAVVLKISSYEIRRNASDDAALIRRLRNNVHYLDEAAAASRTEKSAIWKQLVQDADVPDAKKGNFNAARDSRLSLVVSIFELHNLYKVYNKLGSDPEDAVIRSLFYGAMLSTTSAFLDLGSVYVKGMHALKDKAIGFQALKFAGGLFSIGASIFAGIADLDNRALAKKNSQYVLGHLYLIRGGLQFSNGMLTFLMTLSYCSPMISAYGAKLSEKAGSSFAKAMAGKAIQAVGKWTLAYRGVIFLLTIEASILILAVTIVIWKFEDDMLQKWIRKSAFGIDRRREKLAYTSAEKQSAELASALSEIAR